MKKTVKAGYLEYYSFVREYKDEVKKRLGYYFHLGKGDVDRNTFPTTSTLLSALKDGIDRQYMGYSHPLGRSDTRKLLALYENLRTGDTNITENNIALNSSTTNSLYTVLLALRKFIPEPKRQVLLFKPGYMDYKSVCELTQYHYNQVNCTEANNFLPSYSDIESVKTDNIGIVILGVPNFPFGRIHSRVVYSKIIEYFIAKGVYIIVDEVFYGLPLFNNGTAEIINRCNDKIIILRGYSKDRGVSGFRIGYAIANRNIFDELASINELVIGCPPTVFEPFIDKDTLLRIEKLKRTKNLKINPFELVKEQIKKEILANYENDYLQYENDLAKIKKGYEDNVIAVENFMKKSKDMKCIRPQFGYNMGLQIRSSFSDRKLFKEVFFNTGVLLTPGFNFDMPEQEKNWVRITIANRQTDIIGALDRVERFLSRTN